MSNEKKGINFLQVYIRLKMIMSLFFLSVVALQANRGI